MHFGEKGDRPVHFAGAFSHDVTAALLAFLNNKMSAMLVFQASLGVELSFPLFQ